MLSDDIDPVLTFRYPKRHWLHRRRFKTLSCNIPILQTPRWLIIPFLNRVTLFKTNHGHITAPVISIPMLNSTNNNGRSSDTNAYNSPIFPSVSSSASTLVNSSSMQTKAWYPWADIHYILSEAKLVSQRWGKVVDTRDYSWPQGLR